MKISIASQNLLLTLFSAMGITAFAIKIFSEKNVDKPPNDDFYLKNITEDSNKDHIYWSNYKKPHNSSEIEKYEANKYEEVENLDNNLKDIYDYIDDHTFKIVTSCKLGTGWILDFEIPEDNKYPTTWYIATNMHVVNDFYFNTTEYNPYNVVLPKTIEEKYRIANTNKSVNDEHNNGLCALAEKAKISKLQLVKNIPSNQIINKDNLLNDLNASDETVTSIIQIIEPKLFFAALNFLGPRYDKNGNKLPNDNYFKDFAVLEININNEDNARQITNNFYEKYYLKKNKNMKPINVFEKELMSKYKTHDELENLDNFYIGGYPKNDDMQYKFDVNARVNKHTNKITTSKLVNYKTTKEEMKQNSFPLITNSGETINGHINLNALDKTHMVSNTWNDEYIWNWGYSYAIDNIFLSKGASGSMVVDKNKNLLGIHRMNHQELNHGYIDPLRSDGMFVNNKIIWPKYDLIKGVDGQVSSYKSQLEKYKPNVKTYLKSINWNNDENKKNI